MPALPTPRPGRSDGTAPAPRRWQRPPPCRDAGTGRGYKGGSGEMSKMTWRGGALLAPVPPALVSCGTLEEPAVLTVAWTGTLNTRPPRTYVSIRPERNLSLIHIWMYLIDLSRPSGARGFLAPPGLIPPAAAPPASSRNRPVLSGKAFHSGCISLP